MLTSIGADKISLYPEVWLIGTIFGGGLIENLMICCTASLSEEQCADKLSLWARVNFGLTANNYPSSKDETGCLNKNSRPPREGTAPTPPEEDNPLLKRLLDVSCSQKSL